MATLVSEDSKSSIKPCESKTDQETVPLKPIRIDLHELSDASQRDTAHVSQNDHYETLTLADSLPILDDNLIAGIEQEISQKPTTEDHIDELKHTKVGLI